MANKTSPPPAPHQHPACSDCGREFTEKNAAYRDESICLECEGVRVATQPLLRQASQLLYDAVQAYLIDVPDRDLPEGLATVFDGVEDVWRKADGTELTPNHDGKDA